MSNYTHTPENYDCPFCRLGRGDAMLPEHTQQEDVIYHDERCHRLHRPLLVAE